MTVTTSPADPAVEPLVDDPEKTSGDADEARDSGDGRILARAVLRVLLAVASGALFTLALRTQYPDGLRGHSDVVGYPLVANFDIRAYFINYLLVVVAFPVGSIVSYVGIDAGLRRLRRESRPVRQRLFPAPSPDPAIGPDPRRERRLTVLGRVWFVGAVLAAGATVEVGVSGNLVWPLIGAWSVSYVIGVWAVAWLAARYGGVSQSHAVAAMNALFAASALVAIAITVRASMVTLTGTGEVRHIAWLPVSLLVGLTVVAVASVAVGLWRCGSQRWSVLERWTVLLVAAPVALWLLTAGLNGPTPLDFYHEGEVLTATRLIREGAFPWRDVLFIHGLMGDFIPGWAAIELFGDTRWASIAVSGAVLVPLYWIGNYFLCVYLFRRSWLLLLASQLVVVLGTLPSMFRLVLEPYVLLLLAALLRRATWPRAVGFVVVALFQGIAAPETAAFSVAACGVVAVYELVHWERGQRLSLVFARTSRCAVVGVSGLALFFGFLAFHRSLGAFFDYYRTFVPDHEMKGGIPIQSPDRTYVFWMYAPIAVVLVGWWYAAVRLRSRQWFTTQDWVIAAAVIGLLPYYSKFLGRADSHVYNVAAATLVPLLYMVYRVVGSAECWLRTRRFAPWTLSVAVVAAVAILSPGSLGDLVRSVPTRWSAVAQDESTIERIGFTNGELAPPVVADVDAVLDAYAGDDGRVFDFTNSPAMFGYLVDHPVATRYFHVSMAMSEAAQLDLVDELSRERPEIVVYDSTRYGLPAWDGVPNSVRHYLVSDFLLERYEPVLAVHGFTFMRRADIAELPVGQMASRLSEQPTTEGHYFGSECAWGYAPDRLALSPSDAARRTSLRFRQVGPIQTAQGSVAGSSYIVDLPPDARRFDWLEIEATSPLDDDQLFVTDQPEQAAHTISFRSVPDGSAAARVMVGNCPQWFGYRDSLIVASVGGAELTAIRLVE